MTLLSIFAIFGLAFLIKDSAGPFDIMAADIMADVMVGTDKNKI